MKKLLAIIGFTLFFGLIVLIAACSPGTQPSANNPVQGMVIKSGPVSNNLTVTLSNDTGKLKTGEQEIFLAFTDVSGKAIDVGAASLNFYMPPMGSMAAMNDATTLTTTATPGVYRGRVKIEMPGQWQAQIAYEGPAGSGKTTLPVTAQ